jgi:hypothetical protein
VRIFLQGAWTAEVRIQGGVGGSGFLMTTMPSAGNLIGRYFENVTDSVDVKAQLSFQVMLNPVASPPPLLFNVLRRFPCRTRWLEM